MLMDTYSLVTFHFYALEKEMATHSNVLAWRIPGVEEPGRLPSMGSQTVRHNLGTEQQQTKNQNEEKSPSEIEVTCLGVSSDQFH